MKSLWHSLLLVVGLAVPLHAQEAERISVELDGRPYVLELADSPEKRRIGLMFRDRLPPGSGMLFLYERSGDYRIWMKNTRIPLTVLWLDEQARIVHRALLRPCRRDPCPVESAPVPSRYILELPADDFARFRLGQTLPVRGNISGSRPTPGAATVPPADLPRSAATPSD